MKDLFSPGNLVTVTGASLTVVGCIAYITGAVNLSVPTLFYGFPIFLAGLALKTTELQPARRVVPESTLADLREAGPPELTKLLKDVTRWRYGQNAHLESSLIALELWDQNNPPQLVEIEELDTGSGYGIRMRFQMQGVTLSRWQEKQDRLGRFFAKGLKAEILTPNEDEIDLMILPKNLSEKKNLE